MTIYIGIDQSQTNTGFIAVREGETEPLVEQLVGYKLPKTATHQEYHDRCRHICDEIKALIDSLPCDEQISIGMEDYAYAAKFGVAKSAELGAMIKEMLYTNYQFPQIFAPTTIKKWVAGSGRAGKVQMVEAVNENWDRKYSKKSTSPEHNLCDAYAIARYLQHTIDPQPDPPASVKFLQEKEASKKTKKKAKKK